MSNYLRGFDMSNYFVGQIDSLCNYYKEQSMPLSIGQVELISGSTSMLTENNINNVIKDIKNNGLKLGYYAYLYPHVEGVATIEEQGQAFVDAYNSVKDNLGFTPDCKIMIDIEDGAFKKVSMNPTSEYVNEMVTTFVETVNASLGEQEYVVCSSISFINSYFTDINTSIYGLIISDTPSDLMTMEEVKYPLSNYSVNGYDSNWGDNWCGVQFYLGSDQGYDIYTNDFLIQSTPSHLNNPAILEAYSLYNYNNDNPGYTTNVMIGSYDISDNISIIIKNIRTGYITTIVDNISDIDANNISDIVASTVTPANCPLNIDSTSLWLTFTGSSIYESVEASTPNRSTNSGYEIESDFYSISIDGGVTFTPIWKQTRQSDAYYAIPNNGGGDHIQYWGGEPIMTNGYYVNGNIGFSYANPDNLTELLIYNPYYQWFTPQMELVEGDSGFASYTINLYAPCMELAISYNNNEYFTIKTYYEFDRITKYSHRLYNSYSTAIKFYGDVGSQFDSSVGSGNFFTGSALSLPWLNVLVQYPFFHYNSTSAYYYNSGFLKGMKFCPIMAIGEGGGTDNNPPNMCFVTGFTWDDGLGNNSIGWELQDTPIDKSGYANYYAGPWTEVSQNVPYWLTRGWKYNNGYTWRNMLSGGSVEKNAKPTAMAINPSLSEGVIGNVYCGFYYQKNLFSNALDTNYSTTNYSAGAWTNSTTMYLGAPNFLNQTINISPVESSVIDYRAQHLDSWTNIDAMNELTFNLLDSNGNVINYFSDIIFTPDIVAPSDNEVSNNICSYLNNITGKVSFSKGTINLESLKSIFFESQLYGSTVELNQNMIWNNLTTTIEKNYSESGVVSKQYNISDYYVQNYTEVYASEVFGSSTAYGAHFDGSNLIGSTSHNTSIQQNTYITMPVYSVFGAIPIFDYISDTIVDETTDVLTGNQPNNDYGSENVTFSSITTPYFTVYNSTQVEETSEILSTCYYNYLFPDTGALVTSTAITPATNTLSDGTETYFYVNNDDMIASSGYVNYSYANSNYIKGSSYIGIAPSSNIFVFPISLSTASKPNTSWALYITFPCSSTTDSITISGNPTYIPNESFTGINNFNGTYIWYPLLNNVTSQVVPWGYLSENSNAVTVEEKTLNVNVYNENPYYSYINTDPSSDLYNSWTSFNGFINNMDQFNNIALQVIGGDASIQPQMFTTPPFIPNPNITSSSSSSVSEATTTNITNESAYIPTVGELMEVTLGTQNSDGWRFDSEFPLYIIQSGVKMLENMSWVSDNNYSSNVGNLSFEVVGFPTIEQLELKFTIDSIDPFYFVVDQETMGTTGNNNSISYNIPLDLNYIISTMFKDNYNLNNYYSNSLTSNSGYTINYTEVMATLYGTCGDGTKYELDSLQFNYLPDILSYDITMDTSDDENFMNISVTNNTGSYIYSFLLFTQNLSELQSNTFAANYGSSVNGYTGGVSEFNTISSFTGSDYTTLCENSNFLNAMGVIENGETFIYSYPKSDLNTLLDDNGSYNIVVLTASYGSTWVGDSSLYEEGTYNRLNIIVPGEYNNYYIPLEPTIIDPVNIAPFQTNLPLIVTFPEQTASINDNISDFEILVDGLNTYSFSNNDMNFWFAYETEFGSLGQVLSTTTKESISLPLTNFNKSMTVSFSLLCDELMYCSHFFQARIYSNGLGEWSNYSDTVYINIENPSATLNYQNTDDIQLSSDEPIYPYTTARTYLTKLSNSYSVGGFNYPVVSDQTAITFYNLWGCIADAYNYNFAYNIMTGTYSNSSLSDEDITEHSLILDIPSSGALISAAPKEIIINKLNSF